MTSKRKAKKDTSWVTRRKLPVYAREMMREVARHGNRVFIYEWKELFDSFKGPKGASVPILRRLKKTWRRRNPVSS